MATATGVAATTPGILLLTEDKTHRGKITGITIDNQSASLITVGFYDLFTPDASVGTPSPTLQTILRKQVSVGTLLTAVLDDKDLKDVDIFGALYAIASASDPLCVITISYHEE